MNLIIDDFVTLYYLSLIYIFTFRPYSICRILFVVLKWLNFFLFYFFSNMLSKYFLLIWNLFSTLQLDYWSVSWEFNQILLYLVRSSKKGFQQNLLCTYLQPNDSKRKLNGSTVRREGFNSVEERKSWWIGLLTLTLGISY